MTSNEHNGLNSLRPDADAPSGRLVRFLSHHELRKAVRRSPARQPPRPAPAHNLSHRSELERFFAAALDEHQVASYRRTPTETASQRLHVYHRLIRRTAELRGLLRPHESLQDIPPLSSFDQSTPFDPFTDPLPLPLVHHHQPRNLSVEPSQLELEALRILAQDPIPPLLPPSPHHPLYAPALTQRWQEAACCIGAALGLDALPPDVLHPVFIDPNPHLHAPDTKSLHLFETYFSQRLAIRLAALGPARIQNDLQTRYRLLPQEALAQIRLAREQARILTSATLEEHRASLILRLEQIAERARTRHDLRAEVLVARELRVTLGITKANTEDNQDVFADVVREVTTIEPDKLPYVDPADPTDHSEETDP